MKKKIIILVLTSIILSGCYRDVEELLYPDNGNCNTTGVTFSATVVSLLQSNGCMSCHSGGAPSGNISLEGYSHVRTVAQNGKLYGAISHSAGFSPMPQGGNKMSACNINKIKAWMDAGFPNN
jgi:hypothetical protein